MSTLCQFLLSRRNSAS